MEQKCSTCRYWKTLAGSWGACRHPQRRLCEHAWSHPLWEPPTNLFGQLTTETKEGNDGAE